MTSATPPVRAAQLAMVAAGVVALVVVVVIVRASTASSSMAASPRLALAVRHALGRVVRYVLESLVLLVCVLIFTADPDLRRAQDLGGGAAAARAQCRRPVGPAAAASPTS